jgi:hypothetical protein
MILNVQVTYKNRVMPRSVPFLVDTGAERSFIAPVWQKVIVTGLGSPAYRTSGQSGMTLLGEVDFEVAHGFSLQALTTENRLAPLNPDRWVCFAKLRGRPRVGSELRICLLGRDILANWCVYLCPLSRVGFLANNYREIEKALQKVSCLAPMFKKTR